MVCFKEYARFVSDGYNNPSDTFQEQLFNAALGVCGEAGEVADQIKKQLHEHYTRDRREKLIEEIGDVMWYLARVCVLEEIDFEEIFRYNQVKLTTRYPDRLEGNVYNIVQEG